MNPTRNLSPKHRRQTRSRRLVRLCLPAIVLATVLAAPALALADDAPTLDARLLGYQENIVPPSSPVALTWLTMIGLAVVGMGVMFLSARRTHLD